MYVWVFIFLRSCNRLEQLMSERNEQNSIVGGGGGGR